MTKYIEPVEYNRITFIDDDNKEISYTDCFEVSLLRFLHILFVKESSINLKLMIDFMDDSLFCEQIINYFSKYNIVHYDAQYYDTTDGFIERTDWCILLNNTKFFMYKLYKKYEVCATVENLILFFNVYFPKININYVDNCVINFIDFNLSCNIDYKITNYGESIFTKSKLFFTIEQQKYKWIITQYFESIDNNKGSRITGHSQLCFS